MHINMKMIMRVIWSDGEVTKSLRCFELRLLRRVDRALVMMMVMIIMVTQHIPTMTNSHPGGFLSVMIMVGICQVTKSHHLGNSEEAYGDPQQGKDI